MVKQRGVGMGNELVHHPKMVRRPHCDSDFIIFDQAMYCKSQCMCVCVITFTCIEEQRSACWRWQEDEEIWHPLAGCLPAFPFPSPFPPVSEQSQPQHLSITTVSCSLPSLSRWKIIAFFSLQIESLCKKFSFKKISLHTI